MTNLTPNPSFLEGEPLAAPEAWLGSLGNALRRAAGGAGGIGYLERNGYSRQSYGELVEEAERILGGLRGRGLKAGDKVILLLESNRDFIGVLWGCFLGGMVPVPLSIPPGRGELAKPIKAWELVEGALIVCGEPFREGLKEPGRRENGKNRQAATVEELRSGTRDERWHESKGGDLALLLLTSGSTGRPKAVMLTHRNILSRSAGTAQLNGFGAQDISFNWMPLDHVGGIVMFHLRDVYLGCEQLHAPTELVLENPLQWLDWMEQYGVSVTWAPNFAYALINEQQEELGQRKRDLSRLRFILNGGEAIVSRTARRFMELLEPHGLRADAMHPAWGMSETSSGVTYSNRFRRETTRDEDLFVAVGEAIPGIAVRVVDGQGEVSAQGTIGSLQVKGATVTQGYYRQEEITREAFTADGWFKTGDLACVQEGQLTITGREKDVIIINGINYYCHDIETVVEEVPGVEISFTAACPFRRSGDNTDLLVIFFSPASGRSDPLSTLVRNIVSAVVQKARVSPDAVVALPKERIPKTAIGKIPRSGLRDQWLAGELDAVRLREAPAAAPGPDWFFRKAWRPEELGTTGNRPGNILLFADADGVAEAVREEMGSRNGKSFLVYRGTEFRRRNDGAFEIDGRNPAHYLELWSKLESEGFAFNSIGHFWNCGPATEPPASLAELKEQVAEATLGVLFLIQALARAKKTEEELLLTVVSNQVQSIHPGDTPAYARSPLLGLLKVASDEIPWLNCRHVDLPFGKAAARAAKLASECQNFEEKREVAYREGKRLVWGLEKVAAPEPGAAARAIRQRGNYLVTGGLGGIGGVVTRSLIERFDVRLLLIGRSALPPESEWGRATGIVAERIAAWKALQALSPHVVYRACAITDEAALSRIVAEMENRWQSPLDGIFHLAGTYHETLLAEETPEGLDRAFEPKIYGTWVLHQLAKERPQCLFVSFSSLISAFGGYLTGAYSAANNFLDSFAAYQQRETKVAGRSLLWSSWKGTGMSRGVEAREALRLRGYIELEPGPALESLFGALTLPEPNLLIGVDGQNAKVRRFLSPDSIASQTPSPAQEENAPVEPRTETERHLARIWCGLLKRPTIGIRDNFFEIGGKSLLAARMFAQIHKEMGLGLPLATLFSFPTIEQLARVVEQRGAQPFCHLVTIQSGGTEKPLFCFPGGGSDSIVFRNLALELGPRQPVFGLQARGLDGSEAQAGEAWAAGEYPGIEKLAGLFIGEMRKVQPQGPYRMVGHCFGAILAYETAQQLASGGQEVSLLALLDPTAGESISAGVFNSFWDRVAYRVRKAFQQKPFEQLRYLVERFRADISILMVGHRLRSTFDRARALHENYKIRPYPGRITILLASDSRHGQRPQQDPRLAWGRLALDGMDYHVLPGDHHSMLHEHTDDLADKLRECLAAATAQPARANHPAAEAL